MLFQLAAFVLSLFQNLHTFSCFIETNFILMQNSDKTGRNVVNVSPASMKVRPLLQPEGRKSMWQGAIPPETRETKESKEEACANV